MANLNFQQPPRSVANQGLTRGAFSTSSLSGHVTPTSSLFPVATGLNSSFNQSLSPIRNISNMANNRSFTGQRPFQDKRPLQGLGTAPLTSIGNIALSQMRQYGSQMGVSNFPSVFGGVPGENSTPPLLDLSEFPSLTNRGQGESMPQPSPMTGKQPYVGMVKQPTSEAMEFQMSNEDFPALPGTQSHLGGEKGLSGLADGDISEQLTSRAPGAEKTGSRRGIQTSPDGKVSHIPSSMVKDQFGMIGLLQFIRAAESDSNLMSLALGQDLTALGLNLNQPDNLYSSFAGPWADFQCRPQDIDYHVPPEYLVNAGIKDKLATIKLAKYKDELLFYLFYTYVGDYMQICAAAELYERDWRYHVDEKVWLTVVPGMDGTYFFFDPQIWRKVPKEFQLDLTKLEARPSLPPLPQ